jgi:hypothetical protein
MPSEFAARVPLFRAVLHFGNHLGVSISRIALCGILFPPAALEVKPTGGKKWRRHFRRTQENNHYSHALSGKCHPVGIWTPETIT